jgi:hypothetical protein
MARTYRLSAVARPYFEATPQSPLAAFAAEAARHPVFLLR